MGREVKRQARQGRRVRLLFEDEARFGRINDPRRCWAPPGIRPEVSAPFVREYSYVYGAVRPHDGTLDSLVMPFVSAEARSWFLREVSRRHPDEFLLMILDGAGWHISHERVIPPHLRLLALPPYRPQRNPPEHIGDELREKWFTPVVFDSLDAVEDRLVQGLAELEQSPEKVASLTGFDWIITIPLNAT